jgi:hypothetical protein
MSLASRVANLFSGSSITGERDHSKNDFADNGLSNSAVFSDIQAGRGELEADTISQKDIEKEERPPYIHVSYSAYCISR